MADDALERRVDGLLASYGEVMSDVGNLEARANGAEGALRDMRGDVAVLRVDLLATVGQSEARLRAHIDEIDRSCKDFRSEYRKDREKARERAEQKARDKKVSSYVIWAAVVTGGLGVLGAIISAIAAIAGAS